MDKSIQLQFWKRRLSEIHTIETRSSEGGTVSRHNIERKGKSRSVYIPQYEFTTTQSPLFLASQSFPPTCHLINLLTAHNKALSPRNKRKCHTPNADFSSSSVLSSLITTQVSEESQDELLEDPLGRQRKTPGAAPRSRTQAAGCQNFAQG